MSEPRYEKTIRNMTASYMIMKFRSPPPGTGRSRSFSRGDVVIADWFRGEGGIMSMDQGRHQVELREHDQAVDPGHWLDEQQ
ncbi:MAG: hypothetical protein AUK55_01485 [Syntrophobacteraceae bacterium CG2_30_61_12]|nr:MAG: hypothetical protein AUK55_01485 [Syntrophobacteraceae bacterium CG2_30_61_12]